MSMSESEIVDYCESDVELNGAMASGADGKERGNAAHAANSSSVCGGALMWRPGLSGRWGFNSRRTCAHWN